MKRNAITVTLKELIRLAEELKADIEKQGLKINTKFLIPIKNRTEALDGWYFERKYEKKKSNKK